MSESSFKSNLLKFGGINSTKGTINLRGNIKMGGNGSFINQLYVTNLIVTGNATGNGTSSEVILPSSGNIDIRGNVIGAYANVNQIIAVSGNIGNVTFTGENVAVPGQMSVGGNVTAGYFIGNGAFLRNVPGVTTFTASNSSITTGNLIIATDGYLQAAPTGANTITVSVSGPNTGGNLAVLSNAGYISQSILDGYLMIPQGSVANATVRLNSTSSPVGTLLKQEDTGNTYLLTARPANIDSNWIIFNGANFPVTSVFGRIGTVEAVKGDYNDSLIELSAQVGDALLGNSVAGALAYLESGKANIVNGNITATYFVGNGYELTDIKSYEIVNGTSNVAVQQNGNIFMTVGLDNIVTVTPTTVDITGQVDVTGNVVSTYFLGNGSLLTGVSAEVKTISNGSSNVKIVANGVIYMAVTGVSNVLTVTPSTLDMVGQVNATGNVVGQYFVGNGSRLTGVVSTPSGIANGSSSVTIFQNGNISMTVGNVANVVTVTPNTVDIAGQVNSLGNVSAPYFIGNGSLLTDVISIGLTAGTSNVTITRDGNIFMSVGNIANVVTVTPTELNIRGQVNTIGNVAASYFIGNGSQLVDVTSVGVTRGNSNVVIVNNGNISMSVSGVANVLTLTPSALNIRGQVNATGNVVAPYFFGNGSQLTSISGLNNGNSNVVVVTDGNITVSAGGVANVVTFTPSAVDIAGQMVATGNVVAGYFIGDGSQLTGITSTGIAKGNTSITIAGNANISVEVAGVPNVVTVSSSALNVAGQVDVLGNVSASYFVGNGFHLTDITSVGLINGNSNVMIVRNGNISMSVSGVANVVTVAPNVFNIRGQVNATGNVVAPYFVGNGSQLTGISGINNGNSNVVVVTDGNILVSVGGVANVVTFTPSEVDIVGQVNATGNIAASYFIGNGSRLTDVIAMKLVNGNSNVTIVGNGNIFMSAEGVANVITVTSSSLAVAGQVNVVGNVSASYFVGNGSQLIDATSVGLVNGNSAVTIVGNGNIFVTVAGVANVVTVTPTAFGIRGQVNATGNVVAPYFVGNGSQLTDIYRIVNGNSNVTVVNDGNVIVSVGNIANVVTITPDVMNINGQVNVTGNVIASYFIGNGALLTDVSATQLVNGNSSVSVANSGNISMSVGGVDNVVTVTSNSMSIVGQVNVLGNVIAPYFIGNGARLTDVTAIGIENGNSNVVVVRNGNISMSVGNVANVLTLTTTSIGISGQVNSLGNVVAPFFIGNGALITGIPGIFNGNSNVTIVQDGNILLTTRGVANVVTIAPNIININGQVNVIGNVAASFFTGDGSRLSNVAASSLVNGTSNVVIIGNGNISWSVAGVANVVTVTPTTLNITGRLNAGGNVSAPYFFGNGAFLTGIGWGNLVTLPGAQGMVASGNEGMMLIYKDKLLSSGQGWSFGSGRTFGYPTTNPILSVVNFPDAGGIANVYYSQWNAAALNKFGQVYCWGSQISSPVPTRVALPGPAIQIAGGIQRWNQGASGTFAAILGNGQLYMWGSNLSGALGRGNTTDSNTPAVPTGFASANVIKVCISSNYYGSVGALLGNGQLYTWGYNSVGQLGLGTTTTNILAPTRVGTFTNVTDFYFCSSLFNTTDTTTARILLANGTSFACGTNGVGALGIGTNTNVSSFTRESTNRSNIAAISFVTQNFDSAHLIIQNDGQMLFSGVRSLLVPGSATNTFVNDGGFNTLGFQRNMLANVGNPFTTPIIRSYTSPADTSFTASGILDNTGNLYLIGYNTAGNFGDGTTTNKTSFIQVNQYFPENLRARDFIFSGFDTNGTIVSLEDGTVIGAGRNNYGSIPSETNLATVGVINPYYRYLIGFGKTDKI